MRLECLPSLPYDPSQHHLRMPQHSPPLHALLQSSSLNTRKLDALETIRSSTEDIRASVPFVLGRVNSGGLEQEGEATALSGPSLLWPLNIMQQMKTAPMTDRLWASDVLVEIGQRTGIRRAWMLAKRRIETGDTPKFEDCDVGYGVRASEILI